MGIYDREYYRKEGPNYLDRLVPSGSVSKWLIGINLVIFLVQVLFHGQQSYWLEQHFSLWTPAVVYEGEVWRLLSYAFLHGDFWHVGLNMLFLWFFGSELEERYGSREFLTVYLLSAMAGGGAYMLHGYADPRLFMIPCLGASAAITATMLLYAIHWPRRTILVMFVFPLPIWVFVVFSVLKDVLGLYGGSQGVAVSAHLGGAAFAGLYYWSGWRITGFWQGFQNWRKQRSRPRLRIYRPQDKEAVPVGAPLAMEVDEHLEAKVDAVLEKVARSGKDSLTEQEKQILLRASEIYKKRRT